MPTLLQDLRVKEVSLVDAGANPGARVALFKREDAWDPNDEICKAVDGQTVQGKTFPKGDFAYTPDDTPSHWKLRLTREPGGKPDAGIVGAAVAALGKGFRGNKVQIPADALPSVKARVRAAWRKANPTRGDDELPSVLKGATMTIEQIEKQLGEQGALISTLKTDNETLKAENAAIKAAGEVVKAEAQLVLKMSKKDRKAYASMSEEKRKEYMAADAEKRKGMVDAACKALKPADDEPDEDDKEAKKAQADLVAKVDAGAVALKAAQEQVTKAEARVAAIEKQARVEHFQKMAEAELPNTSGSPVEKGEMLMTLADTLPGGETGDNFKKYLNNLKKADEALASKFTEFGKVGGGDLEVTKLMEAKAMDIAKRDSISPEEAFLKALTENPDLYEQYSRERPTRSLA